MISFPEHCKVGRVVAKEKIYAKLKASERLRTKFVEQVEQIVWSYKLAPVSLHIPERDGVNEIQVFTVALRKQDFDFEILRAIDQAIPFPIFFRMRAGEVENWVAGIKKIAGNAVAKENPVEYFSSGWYITPGDSLPMPTALDMGGLYVALLRSVAQLPQNLCCGGLDQFIARVSERRKLERELADLEKKCATERQFDRRMELNRQLRALKNVLRRKKDEELSQ